MATKKKKRTELTKRTTERVGLRGRDGRAASLVLAPRGRGGRARRFVGTSTATAATAANNNYKDDDDNDGDDDSDEDSDDDDDGKETTTIRPTTKRKSGLRGDRRVRTAHDGDVSGVIVQAVPFLRC